MILFIPNSAEPQQYVEGENCDRVLDHEGPSPVVKVLKGKFIEIYRGIPYLLVVNRDLDREGGYHSPTHSSRGYFRNGGGGGAPDGGGEGSDV